MSQENVEVVRRGWKATLEEDLPTALASLDPVIEVPDAGVFHDNDGFLAWLAGWGESWASWAVEDLEIRSAGDDQVLATFEMVATA
jgi:hypothetical protein